MVAYTKGFLEEENFQPEDLVSEWRPIHDIIQALIAGSVWWTMYDLRQGITAGLCKGSGGGVGTAWWGVFTAAKPMDVWWVLQGITSARDIKGKVAR